MPYVVARHPVHGRFTADFSAWALGGHPIDKAFLAPRWNRIKQWRRAKEIAAALRRSPTVTTIVGETYHEVPPEEFHWTIED